MVFLQRMGNNVGKGKNVGYELFAPFSTMFSKTLLFFSIVGTPDCLVKG